MDKETARVIYDHPTSRRADAEAPDASDTVGNAPSRRGSEPRAPSPAERRISTQYDDDLKAIHEFAKDRESRIRRVADAVSSAGIVLYDDKIFESLAGADIRHALGKVRGTAVEPAAERERYDAVVDALRTELGDHEFEIWLRRTRRFVASQPKLARVIAEANATNDPTLVRGLIAHVRRNDLGREDSGSVLDV